MKRAMVIGSSGQVARGLVEALRARDVDTLISSSSGKPGSLPLDLSVPTSIQEFFRAAESRWPGEKVEVFLAGAMTHVDRCEAEREKCEKINALGPELVAKECKRRGYPLTYFSTEYVFGGAEYEGGAIGPFTELDPPAPTSWYGACKLRAEQSVLETLGQDALVVRTTMVFSWDTQGMNFLMQYLRQLEDIHQGKSPAIFRVPQDQISTPTYAPWLAEAVCALREKGATGIFNLVGSDCLSRKALVERVIEAFGFDRAKSLAGFQFLQTAALGQAARRPLTAGLTVEKARAFGCPPLSLAEAFAEVKKLRR